MGTSSGKVLDNASNYNRCLCLSFMDLSLCCAWRVWLQLGPTANQRKAAKGQEDGAEKGRLGAADSAAAQQKNLQNEGC